MKALQNRKLYQYVTQLTSFSFDYILSISFLYQPRFQSLGIWSSVNQRLYISSNYGFLGLRPLGHLAGVNAQACSPPFHFRGNPNFAQLSSPWDIYVPFSDHFSFLGQFLLSSLPTVPWVWLVAWGCGLETLPVSLPPSPNLTSLNYCLLLSLLLTSRI